MRARFERFHGDADSVVLELAKAECAVSSHRADRPALRYSSVTFGTQRGSQVGTDRQSAVLNDIRVAVTNDQPPRFRHCSKRIGFATSSSSHGRRMTESHPSSANPTGGYWMERARIRSAACGAGAKPSGADDSPVRE